MIPMITCRIIEPISVYANPESSSTYILSTAVLNTANSRFIVTPPLRKDWKKPGPTCRPMEKTKRMRPKSFMKVSTTGSDRRPK